MAKLLIDEPPLHLFPTLAALIGLNEAIVIQQLHYRLQLLRESGEDRKWVRDCYEDWRHQFPFWSAGTIKRAFISLEKQGLITSRQFEKNESSMVKWYSINYTALKILEASSVTTRNGPNWHDETNSYEALQQNAHEITPIKPAGGLSQHSLENCRKYAWWLHDTNQGIKKPEAFAIACWRTAFADDRISDFLASSHERGSATRPVAVAHQSARCLECGRTEACSDSYLECSLAPIPEGIFGTYKAAG